MAYVVTSKDNVKVRDVGGKCFNLIRLINAGFPVPESFFIIAKAYEDFVEENDLKEKILGIVKKINYDDVKSLSSASDEIRKLIVEAKMPSKIRDEIVDSYKKLYGAPPVNLDFVRPMDLPYVAVRSSGIMEDIEKASSAGQYETFLNVKGEENLIKAVLKCWASLYTARVMYYRNKSNQPQDTSIGVAVMRMVNSEGSGVAFTVDPTNPKEGSNHIVIEACWGLGESLVQGRVQPDKYVVDKTNGDILDKFIGKKNTEMIRDVMYGVTITRNVPQDRVEKQVLSDYEIVALAAYCKKIEQYYNIPQDIEWALERGRLYIVQSRAVTALEEKKTETIQGTSILEGHGASPGIASGTVKIIHDASELNKIQKGDILVTKMTNPDFVVAMERSVAIVTDEGGITCIGRGTKVLTDKGFMNIENAYDEIKVGKRLKTLSLNVETLKLEWRDIIDAQKRTSDVFVNNVFLHPTNKGVNTISITPDHKMLTIEGRSIIKKQLIDLYKDNENLIIADNIPLLEDRYSNISPQLMYLSGAIFSDGSLAYKNSNPIGTRFSQKPVQSKEQFISRVVKDFEDEFDASFKGYCINKFSGTLEFSSNKKMPAETLYNIKEKLTDIMLFSNEEEITNFLAGFSDGDGHLNKEKGWLELFIDSKQENITQALVIACLRLSIPFRISRKKENCTVLTLSNCEKLDTILSKCSRIKTKRFSRTEDYKLFSARQLIGNIREDIDWRGNLWTYVKRNSMIGINKLVNYVRDEKVKEDLRKFADSDIRMMRSEMVGIKNHEDVFNLTIDAVNEEDHNFVVFTDNYTPIVVGNCHAAIVSRELSIPCIVGTKTATQVLKEGMKITVDATNGKVYSGETEIKEKEIKEKIEKKTKVQIKVNLAFPETAEKAKNADGVGLLRLEHMLTKTGMHPIEYIRQGKGEELTRIIFEGVEKVAQAFFPKKVWVRSLDARTDEFRNMKGGEKEPKEDNPMLGWHGIRRSLDEPEILRCELEALKQLHVKGLTNVVWELPFIINVSELKRAKEIAQEIEAPTNFGIMVEVPACALTIEEFCKEGIAFASFGSNDLTQTTLGLDRNNERLITIFDEMHPSMQFLFEHVIETCKKYKVESSICGELPSNRRDAVEFLIKTGIDSLSVNIDALEKVREWASEIEA